MNIGMESLGYYDVIVAGAGPTGLMLACELKLQGASVAIVEKRTHGTTGESRAPGINARSMEIFDMRGFADRLKEKGHPLPFTLFSSMPMNPKAIQEDWPDALILPQHQTEKILAGHAEDLGIDIYWSTALIYFEQHADAVEAVVQQNGALKVVTARFLAGCDGGNSITRQLCGEAFTGEDPVSDWIVADVQLASPPDEHARFGRNARIGTYQVSNIEDDWYRVSLMKIEAPLDRRLPVTLEEVRQAMVEGIGSDYGLYNARWMSRFGDGFRQVKKYRFQRVFLVGDAAHTHSPIGGQGLNLGIQDAVNLGWKLGMVVTGKASETLLDTFETERHPVGAKVLEMTKAQTALIKPGPQIEALRKVVGSMLQTPAVTLHLSGILSGLGVRYPWGEGRHPMVGQRIPNLSIQRAAGEINLFDLMHAARPMLISFNDFDNPGLPAMYNDKVDVVQCTYMKDAPLWNLPVIGNCAALKRAFIRPDGFVAWTQQAGEQFNADQLVMELNKWIG